MTRGLFIAICLSALGSLTSLKAQTPPQYFWKGSTGSAWNDASSWTASGLNLSSRFPAGVSNAYFFSTAQATTVDLGAGAITTLLYFSNAPTGFVFGAGEIGSQTLTLVPDSEAFGDEGRIIMASNFPEMVTINANLRLGDSNSDPGPFTFATQTEDGLLKLAGNIIAVHASLLQMRGISSGTARYEISGAISGTMDLAIQQKAKVLLSAINSYVGATLISSGSILTLGISGAVPDSSKMQLSKGTFATGGFSETLGSLELTDDSTIDFGSGSSVLAFADSSALAWTGVLSLANFDIGIDVLKFGSTDTALTSTQLNQISLPGYQASLKSDGTVSFAAIPEPSTMLLVLTGGVVGIFALFSSRIRSQK
jgi:hypothetical protein